MLESNILTEKEKYWTEALSLFLSSKQSENTRRSYKHSIKEFLTYSNKTPWEIGKDDCQRYVNSLKDKGLTNETINLKVAAISSFYNFVINDYEITTLEGNKSGLALYNPATARCLRPKTTQYGKAISLSIKEIQLLLLAIRRDTIQGLRDYALFLTYLYTGRRNSEIRLLRWGDFQDDGERIMYRWSGKGKKDQLYELPFPVYTAIKEYLQISNRFNKMQTTDYIFIPTNSEISKPISMRQVGKLLKQYAEKAGLDTKKIHVHTLRHTAAHLRKESGDSLEDISDFLSHSSLAITQIYLQRTEGRKDKSWERVEALIGI